MTAWSTTGRMECECQSVATQLRLAHASSLYDGYGNILEVQQLVQSAVLEESVR